MLTLKIKAASGETRFEAKGEVIDVLYTEEYREGDVISVTSDADTSLALALDPCMKESIVFCPQKEFSFPVPFGQLASACYGKGAFSGTEHRITARVPEEEELYGTRNIALNAHDRRGETRFFPHAYANYVTREDPGFFERNAIDGLTDNQGHGPFPYQSWAGGAREDLEWWLDFGREVELDTLYFWLRADFAPEPDGTPHDSYWKNIDIELSDGTVLHGSFTMDGTKLNPANSVGLPVDCGGRRTRTLHLFNFIQNTEKLSFAALTQLEAIGRIIKEEPETMEVRMASNAKDVKYYTTERLREEFHIANLFTKDNVRMVYSHIDRIITAGLMPVKLELVLEAGKELAAEYFLERREMGCINIGGDGIITVDGVTYEMKPRDGIYIGRGNKDIRFRSVDPANPAKFYVSSCPAHTSYPTVKIDISKARKVPCGTVEDCNKRVINQYIHPDVMQSCQLAMGLTQLEPGSNWNTMPCHTHDRRMEVYLYLDMGENDVVFHMMGEPKETRHIIMHNEEAVISPSWSIHSGVGTRNYSFIWAMCGENQEFDDMDHIETKDLL